MDDLSFRLNVSINDRTGEPRAAYLQVRGGAVAETRDVGEGRAYADYREDGRLLGIEFLAPCRVEVLDAVTLHEPEPVREFFRSATPRKLVTAG